MKYSLQWLNGHIEGTLPQAEKLVAEITEKAFEVEGVESHNGDTIIEAKILPDRAHDALNHRGMAREIAALFGLKRKAYSYSWPEFDTALSPIPVKIEDPNLCMRYIGVVVEGVSPKDSPKWLKDRLESVGQRSINAIVDITNFVMFDIGQPMHAFDAKKVKGEITIRLAKKGETMTTLDNKTLMLDGTEQVIADEEGVLALAGVKGGKKAEVDEKTTSIILESANFQPTLTRRTSTKHNIKTDASKRYENGITSTFAEEGAKKALALLAELYPDARVALVSDAYPKPEREYKTGVSASEIGKLLGVAITDREVGEILTRVSLQFEIVSPRDRIVELALSVVDRPYKLGASVTHDAPDAFDCSSLVAWLYKEAGFSAPRISIDQFVYARVISKEDLLPGDLVFTNSPNSEEGKETVRYKSVEWLSGTQVVHGIDHVAVYVGGGNIVHATKWGNRVRKEFLDTSERFTGAFWCGRVIEDNEPRFVVAVPPERLDLRRPYDLVEEVGRHYGYNKIASIAPKLSKEGKARKRLHFANMMRKFLVERGYSEVYTYSFAKKGQGDVEVMNPVGEDRPFVRNSMVGGFRDAIEMNRLNAPVIGIERVKMFEFGNVFPNGEERHAFAIGVAPGGAKAMRDMKQVLEEALESIGAGQNVEMKEETDPRTWIEVDFDAVIAQLPEPTTYETLGASGDGVMYRRVSPYPFVARDIAVFVPENVTQSELEEVITKNAGDLVMRFSQFDKFQKPGEDRISYAYRLVFQSYERTLTDLDVNAHMERVYAAIAKREGWQVR